jgi:hypothetical protein
MTSRVVEYCGLLLVGALAGCGGDDPMTLIDVDAGDASLATDSSVDSSLPVDTGAGDAADAAIVDSALGDAADSGVTDAPYDGPPIIVLDGGTPQDSGPGGTTTSIACGATTCAIPSTQCCVSPNASPPPAFGFACVSGAGCPDAGPGVIGPTALKCSATANCPTNQICCMTQKQGIITSGCQTACASNQAQLCDSALGFPDGGGPTGCGDAGVCKNNNIGDWGLPQSFATCDGKGN